mmetsp:Transcript_6551/g.15347  ORF Transcript_6551/g.15347 Transcript_6551/m.15347 type:complete len:283 (-) Transcript_6551:693-1541(-)
MQRRDQRLLCFLHTDLQTQHRPLLVPHIQLHVLFPARPRECRLLGPLFFLPLSPDCCKAPLTTPRNTVSSLRGDFETDIHPDSCARRIRPKPLGLVHPQTQHTLHLTASILLLRPLDHLPELLLDHVGEHELARERLLEHALDHPRDPWDGSCGDAEESDSELHLRVLCRRHAAAAKVRRRILQLHLHPGWELYVQVVDSDCEGERPGLDINAELRLPVCLPPPSTPDLDGVVGESGEDAEVHEPRGRGAEVALLERELVGGALSIALGKGLLHLGCHAQAD